MTHPESISKVSHILGILTDHIATSQLATTKSPVTCVFMIQKNTKKNETSGNCLKVCCNHFWSFLFNGDFTEKIRLSSTSTCGLLTPRKFQKKKLMSQFQENCRKGEQKDGSYFVGTFRWRAGVQLEKQKSCYSSRRNHYTVENRIKWDPYEAIALLADRRLFK